MRESPATLDIVALDAKNSLDFIHEVFRLYNLGQAFAICRPQTDIKEYRGLRVVEHITIGERHGWAQPVWTAPVETARSAIAQIVFTSGTEGKPKAIALSRGALMDVEDRLISVMGVDSSIREYIGVPVTYSFGLGRARMVARAGGAFYLPERFNPSEIRDMLARGEINAISAVPSLWRVLLANPDLFSDLGARVRWIEIGSQYMAAEEKAALRAMFPQARIVQHYGLTEASRTTFLVIDQTADERLESVGGPVGDVEVRIGEEGEICIRGPHVASGIINDDGILTPLVDADGWLHTRDRGEWIDGSLYYRGRLDDQINLAGIKFAAEALEQDVAALVTLEPGHFALSSVEDAVRGETILLAHDSIAAPHAPALEAALVQALAARGVQAGNQIRILAVDTLPRTDTGKVQRKQLRAMWTEQAPVPAPSIRANGTGNSVRDVFQRCFPLKQIDDESSFVRLDGDSLTYIDFVLGLERLLGPLPDGWESMSVAELAALAPADRKPSRWVTVEPNVFVRAAAPVMVVCNHAGISALSGGAAILMVVAGQNFAKFGLGDLAQGRQAKVLRTFLISVLVPYWLILIGYQSLRGKPLLPDILLFKNLIGWPGAEPFQTWFIQALFHAVLLVTLLSLIPAVRRTLAERPQKVALTILAGAAVVGLIHRFFLMDVLDNVGRETSYVFWMFALGLCLGVVTKLRDKIVVLATALVMSACIYGNDMSRFASVSAGTLLLLLNYRIPVPRFLIPALTILGSSSLFIYMVHARAPVNSFTADWPVDIIRIGAGVLLGIVTYLVYDRLALRARFALGRITARQKAGSTS